MSEWIEKQPGNPKVLLGSAIGKALRYSAASAMSETVQELGLAVGLATLGSLTTFVYRSDC